MAGITTTPFETLRDLLADNLTDPLSSRGGTFVTHAKPNKKAKFPNIGIFPSSGGKKAGDQYVGNDVDGATKGWLHTSVWSVRVYCKDGSNEDDIHTIATVKYSGTRLCAYYADQIHNLLLQNRQANRVSGLQKTEVVGGPRYVGFDEELHCHIYELDVLVEYTDTYTP